MKTSDILAYLDLSLDESRTFEALLSEPQGVTVFMLKKKMNKPRATLYDHLNILIEKGLVKKGISDNGSLFYPEDHDTILALFEQRSHEIKNAKKDMKILLSSLPEHSSYNPRLSIINNSQAADSIFRDVLRSREKQSYWFWPASEMLKTISDEVFEHWYTERINRNMQIKVLWPHKQKVYLKENTILGSGKDTEALREIRILPAPIESTIGYGIYGNKVGFISSKSESYGFIVDSQELAQTLKSQFDFFWKISKKRK